eukprot:scaffold22523_cov67-Skeletonema_menzelii.AAC.1
MNFGGKGKNEGLHSHNQNPMLTLMGGKGDATATATATTVMEKNIIFNILQLCHKAHKTIDFLVVEDLCKKQKVLAWIDDAYEKIYNFVVLSDDSLQLFNGFGAKLKKPTRQEQVSICGVKGGGIIAMICNLVLWSAFNEDCNNIIVECLESRMQQQLAFANAQPQYCPNKDFLVWIAALVTSCQATVNYACEKVYLESKKLEWGVDDALIVNEPLLIEACYLSYAVASSFSPAVSLFIDMNSKMKDCGGIHAISFVKIFVKYLGRAKPDVPIKKPLSQLFVVTKMDQSKFCIDWFLTAFRKAYKNKFEIKTQHQHQHQHQHQQYLELKIHLSEMLQLKEIKALYKVVWKVKQERMELEQVEATAVEALWSLGANGIPKSKSDQNLFATCLAILTMFAYELHEFLLKSHKTNDDGSSLKETGSGRKILLKFLEPAFAFMDANSKPNRDKGIRERIKDVLWVLIKGSPPLFSDLFVAEVLQGSFSFPTEDTLKHHFPFWFDQVTSGSTLKEQNSNKNLLVGKETRTRDHKIQKRVTKSKDSTDSATGVLVRKGGNSMTEALASAFLFKTNRNESESERKEAETTKVASFDVGENQTSGSRKKGKQTKVTKEMDDKARVKVETELASIKRRKSDKGSKVRFKDKEGGVTGGGLQENESGKSKKGRNNIKMKKVGVLNKKQQHQGLGWDKKRSIDRDRGISPLPNKDTVQTSINSNKTLKNNKDKDQRQQKNNVKNLQKTRALRGAPDAKKRLQLDSIHSLGIGAKMASPSERGALAIADKAHMKMKTKSPMSQDKGLGMKGGKKRKQPQTNRGDNDMYNKFGGETLTCGEPAAKKRQLLGMSSGKEEPTLDTASAVLVPAKMELRRSPRKKNILKK